MKSVKKQIMNILQILEKFEFHVSRTYDGVGVYGFSLLYSAYEHIENLWLEAQRRDIKASKSITLALTRIREIEYLDESDEYDNKERIILLLCIIEKELSNIENVTIIK